MVAFYLLPIPTASSLCYAATFKSNLSSVYLKYEVVHIKISYTFGRKGQLGPANSKIFG